MNEIPIACSLDGEAQKSRGDEWRKLVGANLVENSLIPGSVRLVLRRVDGVRPELDRLIALENSCCPWINWTVEESDVIRVDGTAEREEGTTQLRAWFGPRHARSRVEARQS